MFAEEVLDLPFPLRALLFPDRCTIHTFLTNTTPEIPPFVTRIAELLKIFAIGKFRGRLDF